MWFAQSNFLPQTIVRHFVPRIVLYYCSNLVKNLSLSLKQSDIERKELKKEIFFPDFFDFKNLEVLLFKLNENRQKCDFSGCRSYF